MSASYTEHDDAPDNSTKEREVLVKTTDGEEMNEHTLVVNDKILLVRARSAVPNKCNKRGGYCPRSISRIMVKCPRRGLMNE